MRALDKAALAAALVVLAGIVGHFDAEDVDAQHDFYCSMVATWKTEAARGVPANDRTGWPPYDGECTK
jgi:hypothetical protein